MSLFERYTALKTRRSEETVTPVQAISLETLESIFQECLADLNRRTIQGLLGEANTAMLNGERQAKDHLDKTWENVLAGKATLESFRQAVKDWHTAVLALFTTPQAQGQKAEQGRLL